MIEVSLVDVGIEWFKDIIETVTKWFQRGLTDGYDALTSEMFGTPAPETDSGFVFGTPVNEPWIGIHDALVAGEVTMIALILLVISVQGRNFIKIFNFGSRYEVRRTKKTAWTGVFLIVTWYWIASVCLYMTDAVTIALIPGLDVVVDSMLDFLASTVTNPLQGFFLSAIGGISMWLLQALLFLRRILLVVFIYGMPIGIALAFGNLPVVSRIAKSACIRFVPLLIMPIPVAILFSGYELLFHDGTSSVLAPGVPFLQHIVAVSLPMFSLVIIWKLFGYATPMATRAIETTAGATLKLGAILGAGYLAGPKVAGTAARWGTKAAAGQALAQRSANASTGKSSAGNNADHPGGTNQDSVATDAYGQHGVSAYRRTENDPGYY